MKSWSDFLFRTNAVKPEEISTEQVVPPVQSVENHPTCLAQEYETLPTPFWQTPAFEKMRNSAVMGLVQTGLYMPFNTLNSIILRDQIPLKQAWNKTTFMSNPNTPTGNPNTPTGLYHGLKPTAGKILARTFYRYGNMQHLSNNGYNEYVQALGNTVLDAGFQTFFEGLAQPKTGPFSLSQTFKTIGIPQTLRYLWRATPEIVGKYGFYWVGWAYTNRNFNHFFPNIDPSSYQGFLIKAGILTGIDLVVPGPFEASRSNRQAKLPGEPCPNFLTSIKQSFKPATLARNFMISAPTTVAVKGISALGNVILYHWTHRVAESQAKESTQSVTKS